jgi:hypothetical protein
MAHRLQNKRKAYLVILTLSCAALLSCAKTDAPEKIDFEFTGTVFDKDTNQPLEGAYAIAIYKEIVAGAAGVASHCVRTKGMYTAKDGKFHFPVEKRDGYNPFDVEVIHPDYIAGGADIKPDAIHLRQGAEAYAERNAYMSKQDPSAPRIRGGSVECFYAKNKADVAATIEYLKIKKAVYKKYGIRKEILDSLDDTILRHDSLDGRSPDAIAVYPRRQSD